MKKYKIHFAPVQGIPIGRTGIYMLNFSGEWMLITPRLSGWRKRIHFVRGI